MTSPRNPLRDDPPWLPMETAPHDGSTIVGLYENGDEVELSWASEGRTCMLASVAPGAGTFGPGWEDIENRLVADTPIAWRKP